MVDRDTARGSRSPGKSAKPRLDGRCEWQRGGIALAVSPTRGLYAETIEACNEPSVDRKTEWCAAHKCVDPGCDRARVVGEVCVVHQQGTIFRAREARRKAVTAE